MIRIIDCGSQYSQNIARRVRELKVYSEIVPFTTPLEKIVTSDVEGLIISGGQFSVYDENSPNYDRRVLDSGIPIFGICYGHQSIADIKGGRVEPTKHREYGENEVEIMNESPLWNGISRKTFSVWMSHGDIVEEPPPGFEVLAQSPLGHIAAMQKGNIYSVQFHPEVDHTEYGREILDNFLEICDATRNWDPTKDYERIVDDIKNEVRGKVGVGGISGGVDSSVVSVLMNNIVGDNYNPIFVNNGLLRFNEAEEVMNSLAPFDLGVRYVDASEQFLSKLEGVVNPVEKRKIIGHEFIDVFKREAQNIDKASYLVQGTLYPDVIESVPVYGASSTIKLHHNVGGLPDDIGLDLVEPFRNLFKDEVRKMAEQKLGIPKEIVWRHPFPGPGLAIRIVGGAVTPEKLDILREADNIFIEELKNRKLYNKIDQAFAGLLDSSAVGVKGDAGTYERMVLLRAVVTDDFMTADWYDFEKDDMIDITNRIVNEVRGVSRVLYDTTQKPPATIEWE